MRHLRDWIWVRLRLWRTFKGLQPSRLHWLYPIWTAAVLPKLLPQPQLLPRPLFSVSPLSDVIWYSLKKSKLWTNRDHWGRMCFFLLLMDLWSDKNPWEELTGENWPVKYSMSQPSNLKKICREIDACHQLLSPHNVLRYKFTTNYKFGLHCIRFYLSVDIWLGYYGKG